MSLSAPVCIPGPKGPTQADFKRRPQLFNATRWLRVINSLPPPPQGSQHVVLDQLLTGVPTDGLFNTSNRGDHLEKVGA